MRTILIVDDDASMRFLLKMLFESAGYQVVEAPHGAAALDRVKDARPDLVVTDLMMPMMDGLQLIECLRSDPETKSIPIVATSARLAAGAAAADAVLTKPFDPDDFLEIARTLVEGGPK
jgi:two-component system chemotaxis response regulator CheY